MYILNENNDNVFHSYILVSNMIFKFDVLTLVGHPPLQKPVKSLTLVCNFRTLMLVCKTHHPLHFPN